MAMATARQQFLHELSDIFDAEHRFLQGQHEMLAQATDPQLKEMLREHITQSEHQAINLETAFRVLNAPREYLACEAAKALVSEAGKSIGMTENGALRDTVIAAAADKVEHYEIASYRSLVIEARLLGQPDVMALLEENLRQEELTSQRIEASAPLLQQKALASDGAPSETPAQPISAQIAARMAVVGTDKKPVGAVKEVRDKDFLVDRTMARDLYIPFDAVQRVDKNEVMLSIPADQVGEMKWSTAGLL